MSELGTLLLVERDENVIAQVRSALELEPKCRLHVAGDAETAMRLSERHAPDLILISHPVGETHALALAQRLRGESGPDEALIVLIVDGDVGEIRNAGQTYDIDEYLTRPLQVADLQTKLRMMLRHRRQRDAYRRDQLELKHLRESKAAHFSQQLGLLMRLLEMRLPGSADRGARIAAQTALVAERFGIPEEHLRDLEIAARLHELGRMLSPEVACSPPLPSHLALEHWQYIRTTHALIETIPGLEGAAELIGALYENWDGTGHPSHLLQGQIPLRSRILRTVVDLFAELGTSDAPDMPRVVEDLQAHAGTRYDPMVLVHLRAVLQGADGEDPRGDRLVLSVGDLRVGMVLAEDLLTASGMKLLAKETSLTRPTLDVILRRHADDPMVQGVVVKRS